MVAASDPNFSNREDRLVIGRDGKARKYPPKLAGSKNSVLVKDIDSIIELLLKFNKRYK